MSDNGNEEELGNLSGHYKPATEDSALLVRFVGNTAQIAGTQFKEVDAFQLLAVAEYLKMRGLQIIAIMEAAEIERQARSRIARPGGNPALDPSMLKPS